MVQEIDKSPAQADSPNKPIDLPHKKHGMWVAIAVVTVIFILAVVGGYFGYKYYKKQIDAKKQQKSEQSKQEQAATGNLPAPEPSKTFQADIPPKNLKTEDEIKAQLNGQ